MATLQNQYRNVLLQQEERHAEEKRSLFESHLLKFSALEAQLAETQIRNEDLVQLQTVSSNLKQPVVRVKLLFCSLFIDALIEF